MLRESTRMLSRQRRGVVLVLILGMLALMSLIGVSFATFSGQTQRAARIFSEKFLRPNPQDLVDYALSQLINDTDNPMSAIRGHSLKRDMYGNDGNANGFLQFNPVTQRQIFITNVDLDPATNTRVLTTDLPNASIASYGYNFNRWTIRVFSTTGTQVTQTFEVLQDGGWDSSVGLRTTSGFVQLRILPPVTKPPAPDTIPPSTVPSIPPMTTVSLATPLATNPPTVAIVLDGRYLRGFNGSGISAFDNLLNSTYPYPTTTTTTTADLAGRHPNFRYNGLNYYQDIAGHAWYRRTVGTKGAIGNPDLAGADEDYDAPDLENWFLAVQSADGQVVVPSFHRPSTIFRDPADPNSAVTSDWKKYPIQGFSASDPTIPPAVFQVWSKFLRPRAVDHNWGIPDPTPDSVTGKIEYDVDNDGDGFREGVWLDLGYAPQHDANTGRLYKPLFSFTVIGLNGKLPLNTAGNIQGRRLTSGANGTAGDPTWNHTSHLGVSVNEINPLFALQATFNPASTYNNIGQDGEGAANLLFGLDAGGMPPAGYYSQTDSRNVPVNITQLRTLLTGTRPQADPIKPANVATGPAFGTPAFWSSQFTSNSEKDAVNVGLPGQAYFMPNGIPTASAGDDNEVNGSGYALRNDAPVAGRWGEEYGVPSLLPYSNAVPAYVLWSNPVRAGVSVSPNPAFRFLDGTDDDYDTRDINGELINDLYDVTRSNLVPSEKARRYVIPHDPAGVGRMVARDWNGYLQLVGGHNTLTPQGQWGTGQDIYGRVGYFMYFRPPGVPLPYNITVNNGDLVFPYRPNASHNPTHGYEGFRDPSGIPAVAQYMAAAPWDQDLLTANPGGPSFLLADAGGDINSRPNIPGGVYATTGPANFQGGSSATLIKNGFPFGSLERDEADEMNLFGPSSTDKPFNFRDLDWLYNRDPDITEEPSRLAQLAPISLDAPTTGLIPEAFDSNERRRLFTTEVWDLNRFSFAPDNPSNAFPRNNRQPALWANAGLEYQGLTPAVNWYPTTYPNARANLAPFAHGGRRINLNCPLPVSSDFREPVRQKWMYDTYLMLKEILPPYAVDTPQELAQLSQFVVNIIDFRDTDGTMTQFINYDLAYHPANNTTPADAAYVEFAPTPTPTGNLTPLVQYGMEYQPVAINEVLAFSYRRSTGSANTESEGVATPRLFVELVNTLTRPQVNPSTTLGPCDLDLSKWDLVLLQDQNNDWRNRPDPINGQVIFDPISIGGVDRDPVLKFDVNYTAPATGPEAYNVELISGMTPDPVQAMQGDSTQTVSDAKYFYTLANDRPGQGGEPGNLQDESNVPPEGPTGIRVRPNVRIPGDFVREILNNPGLNVREQRWHWLYLRRPADPLSAADPITNPLVVIDSMRFPYIEGSGTVTNGASSNPTIDFNSAPTIWSASRHQPFMGGQVIYDHATADRLGNGLPNPAVPRPRSAYGTQEQVYPPGTPGPDYQAQWGPVAGNMSDYRPFTKKLHETIGYPNHSASEEPWRHLVFHDRDFTGVAELLLVPGCAPGLFTKQFVDQVYNPDVTVRKLPLYQSVPDFNSSQTNSIGGLQGGETEPTTDFNANPYGPTPVTFPYLPEQFYYTGASPVNDAATVTVPSLVYNVSAQVGGVTGGGWHKMLEFFEVPSSMFGAIGPVSQGENFDWFRQDRVPGKLNLNLIIDEEVFFGLVDDPRLDTRPLQVFNRSNLAGTPIDEVPPLVVSELAPNLVPNFYEYNRGYLKIDSRGGSPAPWTTMKVAFSDFLKLRHGGSGFIYGFGTGAVGEGAPRGAASPIAAERPYRSLSFPDINYTIMRPAGLPPSNVTIPPSTASQNSGVLPATIALAPPTGPLYSGDPGVRNPYLEWANYATTTPPVTLIPPIPPRRLFQIPDFQMRSTVFAPANQLDRNAATERGNVDVNIPIRHGLDASITPIPPAYVGLTNPYSNLFGSAKSLVYQANQAAFDASPDFYGEPDADGRWYSSHFLGGLTAPNRAYTAPAPQVTFGYNPDFDGTRTDSGAYAELTTPTPDPTGNNTTDMRQHPMYRTELLQKVMNLTTVRTHQFAVWITVGFFEVTKAGTASTLEPDTLGPELVQSNGKTQRYRSFFVIDRTRATGFNPTNPGDYNELVVYRRSIE